MISDRKDMIESKQLQKTCCKYGPDLADEQNDEGPTVVESKE